MVYDPSSPEEIRGAMNNAQRYGKLEMIREIKQYLQRKYDNCKGERDEESAEWLDGYAYATKRAISDLSVMETKMKEDWR